MPCSGSGNDPEIDALSDMTHRQGNFLLMAELSSTASCIVLSYFSHQSSLQIRV